MEKQTKKFLNFLLLGREWIQKEVDFEDPELVDTKDITSFYFSETSYINDGEDVYKGKSKRISPTYNVGTRISHGEALEMSKNTGSHDYFVNVAKNYPNISLCKTEVGYIMPMFNEDEITLEEYIANKNKNKS